MIQTLFGSVEPTFLDRMKQAVTRTRENLSERIEEIVSFGKEIDAETLDDLEAEHIRRVLASTATIEEAAHVLGIDASTLYRKRKRYGL